LAKKLNDYLKLKNCYNVKNSRTLANNLVKLKMHKSFRMITFDIKDLYVNIPIHETLNITSTLLLEHNDGYITKQIITLLHIILQQNYFSFQNSIFQPEKGITMGFPTFGIIAEIFLQFHENTHFNQLLDKKSIVFYTIHVNDIFIIYDTDRSTPEKVYNYMSKLQ
jgi:hypothetical protein